MDTLINREAVAGHNNPPDPLLVEASERVTAANAWITTVDDIVDVDQADKAGGFVTQLQATWKTLDDRRKTEKREFEARQKATYDRPLDLLARAKEALQAKIRAFLKKEQERKDAEAQAQREEAERIRREAEAARRKAEAEMAKPGGAVLEAQADADEAAKRAEEAQKAADRGPARAAIKGTFTTRAMTLRTYWLARIVDETAALRAYAKHPEVRAAALAKIQQLANAEATATKDPTKAKAGVEFYSEQR